MLTLPYEEHVLFEEFTEFLTAVHRKLGLVTSTTNKGWEVNTNLSIDAGSRTVVVMEQETRFDHGTGLETFSFFIEDGKALLVGYQINSRDLIIDLVTDEDGAILLHRMRQSNWKGRPGLSCVWGCTIH